MLVTPREEKRENGLGVAGQGHHPLRKKGKKEQWPGKNVPRKGKPRKSFNAAPP